MPASALDSLSKVFTCYLDLQEEKEKRLEEMFESDIDNGFENKYGLKEELPEEGAVALAGKKTQETLTATDSIIDALDMAEAELKRIAEHEVCLLLTWRHLLTDLPLQGKRVNRMKLK